MKKMTAQSTLFKRLPTSSAFAPLAVLSLVLWFAGCKKDDPNCPPDLPCATQNGENTYGCYIDGKPWVAKVEFNVFDPSAHKIEASYDETDYGTFNDNYVRLLGVYYGDTSTSLIIHFNPLQRIGNVVLDSLNFYGIRFRTSHAVYDIDENSPYEINVTKLDFEKNIISGTFFFRGIYKKDTIDITEGRFDIRYSQE